jgi:hypothetical protein
MLRSRFPTENGGSRPAKRAVRLLTARTVARPCGDRCTLAHTEAGMPSAIAPDLSIEVFVSLLCQFEGQFPARSIGNFGQTLSDSSFDLARKKAMNKWEFAY